MEEKRRRKRKKRERGSCQPRNELSLVSRYRKPVYSADRAALVYQRSFCYDDVPLFSPYSRVSFHSGANVVDDVGSRFGSLVCNTPVTEHTEGFR